MGGVDGICSVETQGFTIVGKVKVFPFVLRRLGYRGLRIFAPVGERTEINAGFLATDMAFACEGTQFVAIETEIPKGIKPDVDVLSAFRNESSRSEPMNSATSLAFL